MSGLGPEFGAWRIARQALERARAAEYDAKKELERARAAESERSAWMAYERARAAL